MKLAKMQDEKNLVPYNQAAPNAQMMPQEQGIGQQFMDMAKQRAMTSALNAGQTGLTSALSGSAPVVGSAIEGGSVLGAGAGSGAMAGMASAMPYVGMGLMGAKMLGLFEHGGLVGPLSPQYNSEGTKPDYLDLDGDGNKTEPMKQAAKEKKPQYNAEGTTEMVQEAMPMPQVPMMMMPMPMQPVPQIQTMPAQPMSPVMSEIDKMRAEYLKSLGV